jgi:hypothetical protein
MSREPVLREVELSQPTDGGAMKHVYLLAHGEGIDGDEWDVLSIHSTRALAEAAQERYVSNNCHIEEWPLDPPYPERGPEGVAEHSPGSR